MPKHLIPFPYYGGKASFLKHLLPIVESTPHDVYVEMFAGSLALLLNKTPARYQIANDLSKEINNFWTALRDHPQELIRAVALTPGGELPMHEARDAPPTDDIVEMARRTCCRLNMSFGGKPNPDGATNTMRNTLAYQRRRARDELAAIAARIEDVILENTDATRLIDRVLTHVAKHELKHLPEDDAKRAAVCLFYADPPYLADTRRTGGGEYIEDYQGTASEEFHNKFLDAVLDGAKRGCKFIISGYESQLYSDRLHDWRCEKIIKHVTSTSEGVAGKAIECIWLNYSRRPPILRGAAPDPIKQIVAVREARAERANRERRMRRLIDPDPESED